MNNNYSTSSIHLLTFKKIITSYKEKLLSKENTITKLKKH